MAAIADISVLKADETTSLTYTAFNGSGGDRSPAQWKQSVGQPAAKPSSLYPSVQMEASWNGPKTARVVTVKFVYPQAILSADTSTYTSPHRGVFEGRWVLPQAMPQTDLNEFAAQSGHFCGRPTVVQQIATGYAFT